MITKELSVFINKPLQEVFDFSANPATAGQWQKDVIRSEIDEPLAVGTTGTFVQKFMGREIENRFEITAYDPPNKLCFKTTSGPVSFKGCQEYAVQDTGTKVTMAIEAEVGGFFKVAQGIVGKQFEGTLRADLDNLKAVLER